MSISILTTNVFKLGLRELKFTIDNLANQTFKDFEWVLCDSYYDDNKSLIKELCDSHKIKFVHFPMAGMKHIGSSWHWEPYNNALLISSRPYFIRFGMYRYMHKNTLEFVIKSITEDGIYVDQSQQSAPEEIFDFNGDIEEKYNLKLFSDRITETPATHCGMFSMNREMMIRFNGNNEAATIRHHFEDCDLNVRWRNPNFPRIKMKNLKTSFLRIEHVKILDRTKVDSMDPCFEPHCITNFHGFYDRSVKTHHHIQHFEYRGHPWIACMTCGMMSPAFIDDYFAHLESYKSYIGPIGVRGILGRDIRILEEDLKTFKSLDSKVAVLKASHTEPRYLYDTES